jgi:hypothetical protein
LIIALAHGFRHDDHVVILLLATFLERRLLFMPSAAMAT